MKYLTLTFALFMLLWSAGNAMAAITLDNSGVPSIQQTADHPCVFGGPDCGAAQPVGWSFTDTHSIDNDGTVTFAESSSPTYTVSQISAVVGGLFSVGIDTNQAGSSASDELLLNEFDMLVDGSVVQSYVGPSYLTLNHNGTGWSGAMLHGFSLAGLAGSQQVSFQAYYTNATDGADSFFLISAVPEPEIFAMLAAGLGLIGWVGRRRKLQAA